MVSPYSICPQAEYRPVRGDRSLLPGAKDMRPALCLSAPALYRWPRPTPNNREAGMSHHKHGGDRTIPGAPARAAIRPATSSTKAVRSTPRTEVVARFSGDAPGG